MKRGTSNLKFETVAMDEFPLKWRFTDPLHHQLPPELLGQVRPLAVADATRLRSIIRQSGMFSDVPFTQGYFRSVISTVITTVEDQAQEDDRIRSWLYRLGVPFQREVFLSYEPERALETNWKILVKYW